MKICKCYICKKEFEARNINTKYCSKECKKAGEKLNRAKGDARSRYLMELYHSNTLDGTIQEAFDKGVSYGQLQAERYKKLVTVNNPKPNPKKRVQPSISYEYRKQQFDEIVAQQEVGEWENQNTIGTELSKD